MISKYVYGAIIMAISSLLLVVYIQTISIKDLNKEITSLDIKVGSMKITEEKLRGEVASNKIVNEKLKTVNHQINIELNTLRTHNLENIAIKKPKMLERRINNASDKIWNDIACFSDSSRLCE